MKKKKTLPIEVHKGMSWSSLSFSWMMDECAELTTIGENPYIDSLVTPCIDVCPNGGFILQLADTPLTAALSLRM